MVRTWNKRPLRRLLLVAALLLTASILIGQPLAPTGMGGAAPASASASTPDPASPFGVDGVMRWPNWGTLDQPAKAMVDTGGSWVREDFVWGLIEPKEGQFNWEATDRIMDALRADNLSVLGIIDYSVNWATPASDDDKSPNPDSRYAPDNAKFAQYVRALVLRYKDRVHAWEIWNEPNNDLLWRPAPNGKQYGELLKAAYKAVKDTDPTAKVLSGGVTGNAIPFLEDMVSQGALDSFDILAIHTYAEPVAGSPNPKTEARPEVHKLVEIELAKYRAFLQRHGRSDRPIWVTEMGWPAQSWGLDDNAQADYLAQAYAQALSAGIVDRIFWYSFKDDSANPADSWGLIAWGAGKTDLGPRRASFKAYSTSASMLTGATPAGRIQIAPYSIIENFDQPDAGWSKRPPNTNGSFVIATEQKHSGASSGRLQYSFANTNQSADFAPPQPRPLPGKPTRLGLWVLGDASGNYLSAWLRDRDGELFKVRLGAMRASTDGWRYYESRINNYYFPYEHAAGSAGAAANGVPDYPLSFDSFRIENSPDEPAGGGTIYVDDLQSFDGPDATAVRFTRRDGTAVDVLWSVDPTQVNLPTTSANAQVTDRNGAVKQVNATNGTLSLNVSSSPIYVVHKPAAAPQPLPMASVINSKLDIGTDTSNPAKSTRSAVCAAYPRAQALTFADNRYFPETGHNLHGAFRRYWDAHGGIAILGYPITEEFLATSTDGKSYVQQYFQRARMEYHPDNAPPNDVLLGLMGVSSTIGRNFTAATTTTTTGDTLYFPETGHSIHTFSAWWSANGGLPLFGYPISEEMQETSPTDGKTYTVQYFERNRLEYHPDKAGTPTEVQLGLLGAEWLTKQGCK